jgi:hypothetical protein
LHEPFKERPAHRAVERVHADGGGHAGRDVALPENFGGVGRTLGRCVALTV